MYYVREVRYSSVSIIENIFTIIRLEGTWWASCGFGRSLGFAGVGIEGAGVIRGGRRCLVSEGSAICRNTMVTETLDHRSIFHFYSITTKMM